MFAPFVLGDLAPSASRQSRQDIDLAPWRDGLEPGVPVDPPIDRDRDAPLQMRLQRRVGLTQARQQLPDICGLDLDLGFAARYGFERSPENDIDHQRLLPPFSLLLPFPAACPPIAFRILGGD